MTSLFLKLDLFVLGFTIFASGVTPEGTLRIVICEIKIEPFSN